MKFLCSCGNQIADQGFPNPIGYRIISDSALDELGDAINQDNFDKVSARVFRCTNCKRFFVWWTDYGDISKLEEFVPVNRDGTTP